MKPLFFFVVALSCLLGADALAQEPVHDDVPSDLAMRPSGYPDQIDTKEAEKFFHTLELAGQGCGLSSWSGQSVGMFRNSYRKDGSHEIKTKWAPGKVTVSAIYFRSKEFNDHKWFLSRMTLGDQGYARESLDEDHLRWRRDLSKLEP